MEIPNPLVRRCDFQTKRLKDSAQPLWHMIDSHVNTVYFFSLALNIVAVETDAGRALLFRRCN